MKTSFQCLLLIHLALSSVAVAQISQSPQNPKPSSIIPDCTSAGCHADVLAHKVMHGPVAAKQCLDCHQYSDPALHSFAPVAQADDACLRCHSMPTKSVVHSPVQKGRCTDCHDPHGSEHPKSLLADPAKDLCQTCHKELALPEMASLHSGTSGTCASCHEPHSSDHAQLLKQPSHELCIACHKQTRPVPGETMSMHAPARDNCTACHDPHESKRKHALKQDVPDLCLSCHDKFKHDMASHSVVHGAMVEDQSCLTCHAAHFSRLSKLQKEPQPAQCLGCHDRTVTAADGRTITNMAALLKENQEHHGPIRLGACTACHQPHSTDEPRLLSAAYPPEFYAPFSAEWYQLCFGCHSPELALVPDASAPTGFKDGERNLHWLHVNQEKGRTCRACHEVHASSQPFHIAKSVPFGDTGWAITLNYRKSATGGTCESGCHAEKSYDHGNRPRTLSVVALSPKGQAMLSAEDRGAAGPTTAPIAGVSGDDYLVPAPPFTPGVFPCSSCHDPMQAVNTERRELRKPHEDITLEHDQEHRWCLDCHNTQNRDVLRSASGEPIPFNESYRLCGQCHGGQYRDWKAGVHGKRTGEWDGRKQYLLCVHCHDPHSPKFKHVTPLPPPERPKSH
jgi:predicted CXXCH cytochrome family protein